MRQLEFRLRTGVICIRLGTRFTCGALNVNVQNSLLFDNRPVSCGDPAKNANEQRHGGAACARRRRPVGGNAWCYRALRQQMFRRANDWLRSTDVTVRYRYNRSLTCVDASGCNFSSIRGICKALRPPDAEVQSTLEKLHRPLPQLPRPSLLQRRRKRKR